MSTCICSWQCSAFPSTAASDPKLNNFPNNSHFPNEVFVHAISSAWTLFLLFCLSKILVFRLNLKSPSFMKVSSKLPLFPPTGSNHSLLCGSYTSLKTQPVFFFALWSRMCQLIFPSEGKCCLSLRHRLKSKSRRIMYKALVTWWLLPFESYVLTFPSGDLIPES